MGITIPALLFLALVVLVVVVAIQRTMGKGDEQGDGADIIPYLVLALAMGVAGFALAELAATAFPGESFVFDPADNLATSLSALVVSAPFVIYFWRRQAQRREEHPTSAGWTLYLSVMELVFMTAFVVTAIMFVHGLFSEDPISSWPRMIVFGAIVVFHEIAARQTPPLSDAGELRRVIGAAIGLIPAVVGLAGLLFALVDAVDFVTEPATDPDLQPFAAMAIVGLPVWWYRWMRPWEAAPAGPRQTWTVLVSVGSLAGALGAATGIAVLVLQYLLVSTGPAASHLSPVPEMLTLTIVGSAVWAIHRSNLNDMGASSLAVYRYALAALGLGTAVAMAIGLTVTAFDRSLIVGGSPPDLVAFAVVLLTGIAVWLVFERRATRDTAETPAWPHRLYSLGVGIVFGLIAAGALITTLFILIRRLLGGAEDASMLEPATVLVYTALASWYLLTAYVRTRRDVPAEDRVAPFQVTIVCSHPGMVATKFPEQARLRVLHRGDDAGSIDEEMADEIVAAVDHRPSFVWVDADGFRVAPMRARD